MKLRFQTSIILVTCLATSLFAARSFETIRKTGEIALATEGAFPPFNFYKGGTLAGFEIDLVGEIAKRMQVKYAWKTQAFDSLLIGLNQDRYDLVAASHAITPERSQAVEFTDPYYCSGGTILSRKGGPKTLKDLAGKTVAAQVGTTYLAFLESGKGVKEVKTLPKDTDCLQALLGGRVDAVVTDQFAAYEAVKANPTGDLQVGEVVSPERIAMAVAKGNVSLREAVNKALGQVLRDGAYAELSQKYFGRDIRCQ